MFRYRALLVDTEANNERPVQAYFNDLKAAQYWAKLMLKRASARSEVVLYKTTEREIGVINKDDPGTVSDTQPAAEEAD